MLKMRQRSLLELFFCLTLLSLLLPFFTFPASAQGVYEAWVARYNGPGNSQDYASALAVDASGNLYVTGSSDGTGSFNYDYATIKYSSAGDALWVRRYNGPGNNGPDDPFALAVDGSGNLYVTGYSSGSGTGYDYATIKYSPLGDTLWVRRYNGPENDWDGASALAVDASGNVYVTGFSASSSSYPYNYDYATIKYSSAGDSLWVRRYNGSVDSADVANTLAVDGSGNVYVTGSSWGSGTRYDYATIKYSSVGDTLWVRRYNGPGNGDDLASALAVDASGNVYVTGSGGTIKYSANGDSLWFGVYGGGDLAIDASGNVYVTGNPTIKYSPNGDTVWTRRIEAVGYAIAVDGSGNVYVTGYSIGSNSLADYATIKYSPCSAKPGDANKDNQILLSDIITIINFLFKSQPAPSPLCRGDANADGNVLLPDIIYLINSIFKSGPAPVKSGACCL